MKKPLIFLLIVALISITACKEQAETAMEEAKEAMESPDYAAFDKKVEIIKSFYQAHSDEDLEAQTAMLSDTLEWSPPAYNGNKSMGKEDLVAALKGYHDNFENIQWHSGIVMRDSTVNGYWSGSVFPEATATITPDIIRVYGTWTAKHTESGKDIGVKFFSLIGVNEDGMIVSASDYFDVNGIAAQIAAQE